MSRIYKEFEELIKKLDEIIESDPNNADAYCNRAYYYFNLDKIENAISDLEKAIQIYPNFSKTYLGYRLEKYKELLNYQIKAKKSPNDEEVFFKLGTIYSDLNSYVNAINNYTLAIEIKPKLALAYYYRGLAYENINDYDKAVIDFNKHVELNPNAFFDEENK